MTNLDSILKSRHITLPTKVRLVKAVVSAGSVPKAGSKAHAHCGKMKEQKPCPF